MKHHEDGLRPINLIVDDKQVLDVIYMLDSDRNVDKYILRDAFDGSVISPICLGCSSNTKMTSSLTKEVEECPNCFSKEFHKEVFEFEAYTKDNGRETFVKLYKCDKCGCSFNFNSKIIKKVDFYA
jgi:hypothetical protein